MALLALRLADDTPISLLVAPVLAGLGILFLLVVAVAVATSGPGGLARAGVVLLVAAVLAMPMVHVIGRRSCPEIMGPDRGLQAATQVFDAWRNAERPPDVWANADLGPAWTGYVDGLVLHEYRLMGSGCWERLAPVTTVKAWHEFRVIVERADGELFARTLIVHTRAVDDRWAIADVEGLDP